MRTRKRVHYTFIVYGTLYMRSIECCHCRCTVCKKKYTTQKNLQKHHQRKHRDVEFTDGSEQKDAVFNYTSLVITLGLIRNLHNRAIQLGNGEDVISLYK